MGGLIAFLGDKIGSKVGKKRMTLFGLRPKYTSIIVTIISGVLISFLTIAVLAVASENVRVALFGLNRLYAEMDELNTEIAAKNQALADGQRQLQERTREVADIEPAGERHLRRAGPGGGPAELYAEPACRRAGRL